MWRITSIMNTRGMVTELHRESTYWRIKYSNGFMEQGGFVEFTTSNLVTLTFGTAFKAAWGFLRCNSSNSDAEARYRSAGYTSISSTNVTLYVGTTAENGRKFVWRAWGSWS